MSNESAQETRFIQLETKIAYQEKLISELNEVVLAHTRALDRMEIRVKQLEAMLRESPGGPLGHEPPPHY